jgi:hypothetical protein
MRRAGDWSLTLRMVYTACAIRGEREQSVMQKQFDNLRASELYCPRCRTARPVRERLLLVLPRSELHDYRCTVCGESLGSREVSMSSLIAAAKPAQAPRVPHPAPRHPARGKPPKAYLR